MPKVSAIIVSLNQPADLRLSIEALRASRYSDLEIIVVDSASTNDAAAVASSFPEVKLIRSAEDVGFAEGNNVGLRAATGAYVALVNSDAVVEPSWIQRLVDFLEAHPDVAAAGGKAYFWDDDNPVGRRENHYDSFTLMEPDTGYRHPFLDTPDEEREVATLSGCAVMIRRAAIDAVCAGRVRGAAMNGGASEAQLEPFFEPIFVTHYGDTDFFARAIRRGWRLYYTGAPAVWRRVRASTAAPPHRHVDSMERDRLLFVHRNLSQNSLRLVMAKTVTRALEDVTHRPIRLFTGRDSALRGRRDAYRWLLQNAGFLRRTRAAVAGIGAPYEDVVTSIQARAGYFGPRPEVAALVPESARNVVDFGCGAGGLGQGLKAARPGIAVRGVEPVAENAARARQVLDEVVVAGAEDPLPAGWPRPDCIIFADVLEHLVNPWAVLRSARAALAPGGSLVVSVPNVAHRSVLRGVLRGRWDYQDAGVLDRTHLRFFTRQTAIELVEQAGFSVKRAERVVDLNGARFGHTTLLRAVRGHLSRERPDDRGATVAGTIADLYTVQFLILAS